MINSATLEREFYFETANQPGIAGEFTSFLANDVNTDIRSMWATAWGNKGIFHFIPENFNACQDQLSASEYKNVKNHEVLVVRVPDQLGAVSEVTNRLAQAGYNIDFVYTTIYRGEPAVIVSTNDNKQALELFS